MKKTISVLSVLALVGMPTTTAFADSIIRNKKPANRNNFVHMDILTQMNLDNY